MWQSRLYAFIFRRIIGPYLTQSSLQQLHQSLNLSLRQGILTLQNVQFDGEAIRIKLLQHNPSLKLQFKLLLVKRLHVQLKLIYQNSDGEEVTQYQDGNARLVAHLTLDGLDIVLDPMNNSDTNDDNDNGTGNDINSKENQTEHRHNHGHDHKKIKQTRTAAIDADSKPSPMAWRSYMQAAIDSLKLSIDINDLSIRINSRSTSDSDSDSSRESNPSSSISVHVDSISLQEQTPMQKKVEIDTVTIMVGKEREYTSDSTSMHPSNYPSTEPSQEVFRMDGIGTILSTQIHAHSPKHNTTMNSNSSIHKMEQLWDIQLNQSINVGMSFIDVERIVQVIQAFHSSSLCHTRTGNHSKDCDRDSSSQRNSMDTKNRNGLVGRLKQTSCLGGSAQHEEEDEIGLLANIIHKQGDGEYEYMDTLRRRNNQVTNIALGVGPLDYEAEEDSGSDHGNARSTSEVTNQTEVEDFFNSNDEDLLHYRSSLEESINSELGGEGILNGNTKGAESTLTRVHFQMKCATMQLYLSSADETMEIDEYPRECISLTAGEVDASIFESSMTRNVSFDIKDLYIDHLPSCGDSDDALQESMPILRCYRSSSSDLGGAGETFLISLTVDTEIAGEDASHTNANVSIHPLQLVYLDSVMTKVAIGFAGIVTNSNYHEKSGSVGIGKTDEAASGPSPQISTLNFRAVCGGILAILPLQYNEDDRPSNDVLQMVFQRSGYDINAPANQLGPAITFEVSSLSIFVDRIGSLDEHFNDQDEMEVNLSAKSCIVSFVCSMPESSHGKITRKFDIMAFESEDKIDPDAIVKMKFARTNLDSKTEAYKKRRVKFQFPTVTPLASVKASQQCDSQEQKEHSELDNHKKKLRGSDPQLAMLKDLADCERRIEVHIPSLLLDLSALEKDALSTILASSCLSKKKESDAHSENEVKAIVASSSPPLNIVVKCDQCSFSIRQPDETNPSGSEDSNFRYILICDGFKSHFFLNNGQVKNMRLLFQDITLYEGVSKYTCLGTESMDYSSIQQMCKSLRKRRTAGVTSSSAIFFRSKLCHPLSLTTPALLVDILVQRNGDHTERGVHISLYDLTHRYDCKSKWINQLHALCQKSTNEITSNEDFIEDVAISTIDNLFFTLSDCNIDYTAPEEFSTTSRTIFRLGEARLTSNIVAPKGSHSVFKLTVADASVNIANTRVRHNEENQKLSCANIVSLCVGAAAAENNYSFEHAVSRLNFIQAATMDCLDSVISFCSSTRNGDVPGDKSPVADCSITLSIGRIRIYACKDSFLCLIETINEIISDLTMPSPQTLDEMKTIFFSNKIIAEAPDIHGVEALQDENIVPESPLECDPYILHKPSSLREVIDHGLFASGILQEDTKIEERDVIHNFFEVDRLSFTGTGAESSLLRENVIEHDEGDWARVHHLWATDPSIPSNDEQAARWYTENESGSRSTVLMPDHTKVIVDGSARAQTPHLLPRHVPVDPVSNPTSDGDMGSTEFSGCDNPPKVNLRVVINEMSLDCRLFDGFDWSPRRTPQTSVSPLGTLLHDQIDSSNDMFRNTEEDSQRVPRNSQRYFQMSFSGLKLRMDSFEESKEHSLVSCTDLALADFFLLETVSDRTPVRLMGEWVNDEHPRDSNDGLLTMKMVSMYPVDKFSSDGQLMGNESRVTIELLPIRFFIHQVTLRFIRNFFHHDLDDAEGKRARSRSTVIPPELFFPIFKMRPVNIKVDYKPKQVDTAALKDGSLVQLLNVLPLEDMILRLSEVEMRNLTGWGTIISELACNWLQDVSSTQMHKFLTRTSPLHPFATVGDGMKQFLMMPMEEYKQKGNVQKGLRKGTKKLANVLAYETLSVGAKLTGFAAKRLGKQKPHDSLISLPRSMDEVSDHAIESLTRGLKEANTKMIIIPYREYQQSGTRGAVKSVVRGLPVAVCAPLSGAAEAVSYGLYGVRNQLRPNLREEEEVSKRFHDLNN